MSGDGVSGHGVTEHDEGRVSSKDPLNLDIVPVANKGGSYSYKQTFKVADADLLDLSDETIVVHGIDLDGNGMYDDFLEASLPTLCGEIAQRR